MVTMTHVRSLYSNMLVTCYEHGGKKYVAKRHGDFDVFESEYTRQNKVGTLKAQSQDMKNLIYQYKKQGK